MTALAPATWWRGLGSLTRSGSSIEALAWALYDFANTIFSFAIVSFAMSLWTIRFLGEGPGTFWFTVAVSGSVLVNAIVSPILGAMSDRVGRRKPFLAVFTALCIIGTLAIGLVDIRLGLLAFAIANFAYQAALIYYDALLPDVARPIARGRLSGIGVALGYCGTLLVGVLLLAGISTDADGSATASTFALVAGLFLVFAGPLFLVVREPTRAGHPVPGGGRRSVAGPARRDTAARSRDARPAALHRRALLLLGPGEHRDRGHERLRGQRRRLTRSPRRSRSCCCSPSSRSSRRSGGASSPIDGARAGRSSRCWPRGPSAW